MNRSTLGVVTGLKAEARWLSQAGFMVQVGGGTPAGAAVAAQTLLDQGATALVSFGLAGGLQPGLSPGHVLVPPHVITPTGEYECDAALVSFLGGQTPGALLAGQMIASSISEKSMLYQRYKAVAIDLESGAVAALARQNARPFAVLRAIADPAERTLPPAALVALKDDGSLDWGRLIGSILHQPGQISGLIKVGQDAKAARHNLLKRLQIICARRSG